MEQIHVAMEEVCVLGVGGRLGVHYLHTVRQEILFYNPLSPNGDQHLHVRSSHNINM